MTKFCEYYKGKEVLVTGGAGFIGSHIAEALVAAGAQVSVLDNFSTGTVENLRAIMHKVHLLPHDITSFHNCLRATFKKSHVFHCAAMVSVQQSIAAPSLCDYINVDGTKHVLEACRINKVGHVLFSSTAAVYGNNAGPCREQMALDPLSPYASSKLIGEELCKSYAKEHGIKTCALRYFNVYGPRQSATSDYASVVPRFVSALQKQMPLTIYGDGTQTRDFVPVEDIVRANLLCGMLENKAGDILNIATGKSISLLDLIAKLEKDLGVSAAQINFLPSKPGDIKHSSADITRWKEVQVGFDALPKLVQAPAQPEQPSTL